MDSLGSDLQMEVEEKEKMLELLKSMVREKDEILRKKDTELQESKASFSKMKLQLKAKITKLSHELEEAKKASIPDNASDKSSECGDEAPPSEQANRAKLKLLRRKLEDRERQLTEKDELLASRDQQVLAKERVIDERNVVIEQREEMIRTITNQLQQRDKIIQNMGQSEEERPPGEQMDQIYAQILYKDKLIVDLNNKILELDRKIIDLQELAGEKNEVIKGRDKVINVLQTTIVEKEQSLTSQLALIKKLTHKVESNEENLSLLTEKLEKAEHSLKVESERFNLRLNETQKYFEETLGERESEISQLRVIIREREKDVASRDNDLRELLQRHEQDLQEIMSRGEGSMQDHVVKMLEQKLKDVNGVLDSKVQVINVMTNEVAEKDRQLLINTNTIRTLKEKLAISTEQNLLQQQTFADFEMQWKEEKTKLEQRLRSSSEKLEEERGELNLQLHTLQMSLRQYEAAYSQAAVQYNALQERYQQAYLEAQSLKSAETPAGQSGQATPSMDYSELLQQLQSEKALRKTLEEQVSSQNNEICQLRDLQKSTSVAEKIPSKEQEEKEVSTKKEQEQPPEKLSSKSASKKGEKSKAIPVSDSLGSKASEAKLLKIKAQYTAKIKALQKEVEELKKDGGVPALSPDVETLQNRLAEVEEEKGNLMLHLVDFDDTRALQGQLEQQLSELQKQNESLQEVMEHLQQQLQESHLETSNLLKKISEMQQTEEQLHLSYASEKESLLSSEESEKNEMKRELFELKDQCQKLTNEIEEDQKQQHSLQQQLQQAETLISELKSQVQASNAAIEELQKNLVERSEKSSILSGEKVGLEIRVAELEEIRDELEKEKSQLLSQIETLQNENKMEKTQLDFKKEEEKENLQSKIKELQEMLSKEKKISKNQKNEINELLPKLKELENQNQKMEEQQTILQEQLKTLEKAKQETDHLLQETNSVLASIRAEKHQEEESVKELLAKDNKEKEELNEKLHKTSNVLQQQNQEILQIFKALELNPSSLQDLAEAFQRQKSCISQLKTELEMAKKELVDAKETFTKRESEVESLKVQVKNYKKQIQASEESMAEEFGSYKENLLTKDQTIQLLQETVESQNNEMQKFHELQKARDQILSSLELKVEEYESNTLETAKEHNVKVQALQKQLESLEKELSARTQDLNEKESQKTVLSKKLESKEAQVIKQDQEIKGVRQELQEKVAVVAKQQAEKEEHSREFSAQISLLQNQNLAKDAKIESLSQSLAEFSNKFSEISKLNTSIKADKENLVQQLQEYQKIEEVARCLLSQQRLEMLENETRSGSSSEPLIQTYMAHLSAQFQESNRIKFQMENDLQELAGQKDILQTKIQELENLCSIKDGQLLSLESDSSQHQAMVQGLVSERDQKILALQQESNSMSLALEEKRLQEEKMKSDISSLQENLLLKDSELANIRSQLETTRQHQSDAEAELNILQEQIQCKETSQTALQASLAEQQQKVRDLSESFQFALHEKEKLHVEMVNVKNELLLVTNTKLGLEEETNRVKQALFEQERALNEALTNLQTVRVNSQDELKNRDDQIKELKQLFAESQSELSRCSLTVKDVQKELEESEKKFKELQQEKEGVQSEMKLMSGNMKEQDSNLETLEKELVLLTEERNSIQENLAAMSQKLEKLTKTNVDTNEELTNCLANLEAVTKERNQFQEEVAEHLKKIGIIEADILKIKNESKEQENQRLKDLQDSNANSQQLQKEEETVKSELNLLQSEQKAKASEVLRLEESLEESKEKQEELNKELEFLRLEKHDLDLDLNNFKVTLQEKEDLIQNLMLMLDDSKNLKEKMDEEQVAVLQQKESFYETVMCENKKLKQELEELTAKMETLTEEKALLLKQLDSLKDMELEKNDLVSKLEKAVSEKETLKLKLKEAVAKIQSLGSKLKNAVSEKKVLETKLQESSTEMKTLQSKLKETVTEKDALKMKLEESDSSKEILEKRIQDQESMSDKFTSETAERFQNLQAEAESNLAKIKTEIEELSKELLSAESKLQSYEEDKGKLDGLKIQLEAALEENDALREENKGLQASLDQGLHEKDIVADELAQVDMKLVTTIQEKTKAQKHLDELMREHSKCADMEPRLEKALRDKRTLSEELSKVDGKLVKMQADKDGLVKQLAATKQQLEEVAFERQELETLNEQLSEELSEIRENFEQLQKQVLEKENMSKMPKELEEEKEKSNEEKKGEKFKLESQSGISERNQNCSDKKESIANSSNQPGLKNEEVSREVDLETKLFEAEAEISRLTKLYSEQACESEHLFQLKMSEVESLQQSLAEKIEAVAVAESEIKELWCRLENLEKEAKVLDSTSNDHKRAYQDLIKFFEKTTDSLLASLSEGSNHLNANNESVDITATAQVEDGIEGDTLILPDNMFVVANLDIVKAKVSEKISKIQHWQSKVVENGKNDRSSLEKNLQELEASQKEQESQSKLVKKLAQNLKKTKSELSAKAKALKEGDQQRMELDSLLNEERSKMEKAKCDLHNFLLSLSSDPESSAKVELLKSGTDQVDLMSVVKDLKSKVADFQENQGHIVNSLNTMIENQKENIAHLEKVVSSAESSAEAKDEFCEKLQAKYSVSCQEVQVMEAKMSELSEEFSAVQKENAQLMQVSKKLKESRAQKMADIEELKQQMISLEKENGNLIQKFQVTIKELEEKLNIEMLARTNIENTLTKQKDEFDQEHNKFISLKEHCDKMESEQEETAKERKEKLALILAENKELNESLENIKESFFLREKQLSSEIMALQERVQESERLSDKLKMDSEAKDLKISSLNEATQIMKMELEKSYSQIQKMQLDSDGISKENSKTSERLDSLASTLFALLSDIRNAIHNEIENSRSRQKPSVTEDLQEIINKSDNLERSMITPVNPPDVTNEDICSLEEGHWDTGFVFLKWLHEYLVKLWSVQRKESVDAQNMVFELNGVVTSKEETNQDLMDKIENLMIERKKMSEHIASLKNLCEDQKSSMKSRCSDLQKMKQSMETTRYEIFGLLTSVKKVTSSSLLTITEEEEEEEEEEVEIAGDNNKEGSTELTGDNDSNNHQEINDVPDSGSGNSEFPHHLDALQNLAEQVTLLISTYSRTEALCSIQDKEISELQELLKTYEDQKLTSRESSEGRTQNIVLTNNSTKEIESQTGEEFSGQINASKDEDIVQEDQNVSHQNNQVELVQSELERTSHELLQVKQENKETTEKFQMTERHLKDLEKELEEKNKNVTILETRLQDLENNLSTVQCQLNTANTTINQLQSNSSELIEGKESAVNELKTMLIKREEQLQNLSSQLAELMQSNEDQKVKLAKKDEKVMSLLENMQELEEQLNSLNSQREADVDRLSSELAEKTAALEGVEKSLKSKEAQYIKVLATAKKFKLQAEASKKEASEAVNQLKELQDQKAIDSSNAKQLESSIPSADSRERFQELTNQVQTLSEHGQQLQLQVQALTENLHKAEQLADAKDIELERLRASSEEKESLAVSQENLLDDFKKRVASLQDENKTLANAVATKEEQIEALRERAEHLNRKVQSLETETEKDARIRLLNEQLDETSHTMHLLQEEISVREEKLLDLRESESRAKNECERLNEQLEKSTEFGKAKQEISEQLASQTFDLSEELQAKSIRVEELSSQLKATEEKFRTIEVQLSEKESCLEEFKGRLQAAESENRNLAEELKNLKDLYNRHLENLTSQQQELMDKERELVNIREELENMKELISQKDNLWQNQQSTGSVTPQIAEPFSSSRNALSTEMAPQQSTASVSSERPLDHMTIDFPETDFSGMYESLKMEFDLLFSEKECLTYENFELKKLLTESQRKESEVLLKQQESYETRIRELQEQLLVSRGNRTIFEESLGTADDGPSESVKEKNESMEEREEHFTEISERQHIISEKESDSKCQESIEDADSSHVPFVEKITPTFEGPLRQVRVEKEAVQRSAVGSEESETEVEHWRELYEKLSDEHTVLTNQHQVTELKCEKMLVKLKAFKEKNDFLMQELSKLKTSSKLEGTSAQEKELEAEKSRHQETQNLLLEEQENLAKERSKMSKMESVFRNKFQELLEEKNHLGDSSNQLKSKCKELGARLKELLAERQDLHDTIDRLTSESESNLEAANQQHRLEKSSLENKISGLQAECKNAYDDLKDFQNLVGKMKETQEVLKTENQRLKDFVDSLEGEVSKNRSVEEKQNHLESQVQGLQEERKSLHDQVDTAREEALAKMKELEVAKKRLGDIESRMKTQEEQISQFKKHTETLQNAKWTLEADLQACQHQVQLAEQEKNSYYEELSVLRQTAAHNEILRSELTSVESEVERKEESMALFKREVEMLNEQIQSLTSQSRDLESTRQAVTVLKKENASLTDDVMRLNAENTELRLAKEELGIVSDRYNNLLQDNTALAKQIEELLTKLQRTNQLEKDIAFAHEQREHLEREHATFIQRIEELEEQCQQSTNENAQLKQEMVQVNSAQKQMQFENESLKSQMQVMQSGGDRLSRFQEEYDKLQKQFALSVEQNNQVQAEINHSTHRLQLREARCQQLAMQVSQLAEDRSYLNIQMGNLSLALREKEKEATNLSSQCKTWYEKHHHLQQKITELETSRSESLKISNAQTLTGEITRLKKRIEDLEIGEEELKKLNLEQKSQFTSEREQRLLAETNLVQFQEQIKILQQQQLTQDFQIQIDEEQDKILESQQLLSRQGNSYIHRLQRWMMVKKEYFCFSSRQFNRLMRVQPRARTLVRVYFLFLHAIIIACIMGLL